MHTLFNIHAVKKSEMPEKRTRLPEEDTVKIRF